MTAAELERRVLQLSPRELDAVGAFVFALRAPPARSPADLRAAVVLSMSLAPAHHLAALAAAAEALTG